MPCPREPTAGDYNDGSMGEPVGSYYGSSWRYVRCGAGMRVVRLSLSWKGITALPGSIGELAALKYVYLYNNQLTTLPGSMGEMAALEDLRLQNNPLGDVPASTCEAYAQSGIVVLTAFAAAGGTCGGKPPDLPVSTCEAWGEDVLAAWGGADGTCGGRQGLAGACGTGFYTDIAADACLPCPGKFRKQSATTGSALSIGGYQTCSDRLLVTTEAGAWGQAASSAGLVVLIFVALKVLWNHADKESCNLLAFIPSRVELSFGRSTAGLGPAQIMKGGLKEHLKCDADLVHLDDASHPLVPGDRVIVRGGERSHGTVKEVKHETCVIKLDGIKEPVAVEREQLRSHQFIFSVAQEAPAAVHILTDEWMQSDDFVLELVDSLSGRIGLDLDGATEEGVHQKMWSFRMPNCRLCARAASSCSVE